MYVASGCWVKGYPSVEEGGKASPLIVVLVVVVIGASHAAVGTGNAEFVGVALIVLEGAGGGKPPDEVRIDREGLGRGGNRGNQVEYCRPNGGWRGVDDHGVVGSSNEDAWFIGPACRGAVTTLSARCIVCSGWRHDSLACTAIRDDFVGVATADALPLPHDDCRRKVVVVVLEKQGNLIFIVAIQGGEAGDRAHVRECVCFIFSAAAERSWQGRFLLRPQRPLRRIDDSRRWRA